MSNISTALEQISTHRDVVPAYFHRSSGQWIVTGINRTSGGAAIVDQNGAILRLCLSKCDALAILSRK